MGLETIAAYHAETTGIMEDSDLRNAQVWRFAGRRHIPANPPQDRSYILRSLAPE